MSRWKWGSSLNSPGGQVCLVSKVTQKSDPFNSTIVNVLKGRVLICICTVFAFVFLLYLYSARASLLAPCPLSPITSTATKPRRITCLWFSAPTPLETTSLQSFDPLPKVDLALGHRPHHCKHSQRCREGCQRLTRTWGPTNANAWKGRNFMRKWQGF